LRSALTSLTAGAERVRVVYHKYLAGRVMRLRCQYFRQMGDPASRADLVSDLRDRRRRRLKHFQLGRAERPVLHHQERQCQRELAGRDDAGNAGSGHRPHREKSCARARLFRQSTTYTKPGFTSIGIGFQGSTPAAPYQMLFLDLRKKLSDLRGDLPANLIGPNVNDEFGDVDAVLFTIKGDGASYAQLKQVAEAFRLRLQRVPDVTKVDLYGDQPSASFVEFSHAKLATLGVPTQALFDSLSKQNASIQPANSRPRASACRCA